MFFLWVLLETDHNGEQGGLEAALTHAEGEREDTRTTCVPGTTASHVLLESGIEQDILVSKQPLVTSNQTQIQADIFPTATVKSNTSKLATSY